MAPLAGATAIIVLAMPSAEATIGTGGWPDASLGNCRVGGDGAIKGAAMAGAAGPRAAMASTDVPADAAGAAGVAPGREGAGCWIGSGLAESRIGAA
jgi:hypothetical protein